MIDFLTLHVSAGTFLPVKTENAMDHPMHEEQVVISKQSILNLLLTDKIPVAVGTTAMRTLESLYWYGVNLMRDPQAALSIDSFEPYKNHIHLPSKAEALTHVLNYMNRHNITQITGQTSIYIFPGYQFRVCDGLITNFHQPGSTLLLLVAGFVGPVWKTIYKEALDNGYRFLSYGDSSLLLR
jgi:S-adenosylmethionine:tRNA ribosyltransferase-isomerase